MQLRESAGELSYLAIRLLDFVAALPPGTLPPRGRVPWSANELTELDRLAHVLARGELDAERATTSMRAIDDLFQRPYNQTAPGGGPAEAALLEGYVGHRRIAMVSLPRLQQLGDGQSGTPSTPRPTRRVSWWRAALRALGIRLASQAVTRRRERECESQGSLA
jgi:hypothetical protein